MSRYVNTFNTNLTEQESAAIVQQYMLSEGFAFETYKTSEQVWKKGHGLLVAPQYIKVTHQQDRITVEAFLKWALLPGVYAGEMGLSGAMAAPVKATLRGRVNQLEQMLQQAAYYKSQQSQPAQQGQPVQQSQPAQQGQQPVAR